VKTTTPTLTTKNPLEDGTLSYVELVRRQTLKDYGTLDVPNLEKYLSTAEFERLFQMNRDDFYALPKWRQKMKKQMLNLF